MLTAGKAVKVSIYLSEGSTHHGMSTYSSILDFLFFRGVSGATVLKGVAGFGADHHIHSSSTGRHLGPPPSENRVHRDAGKGRRVARQAGRNGRLRNDRDAGNNDRQAGAGLKTQESCSRRSTSRSKARQR